MTLSSVALVSSFALLTIACGASMSPARAETAAGSVDDLSRPFVIAPLHLRSPAGATQPIDVALDSDGSVTADGVRIGRIDGSRLLSAEGAEIFSVGRDGFLATNGRPGHARMLADGDIDPREDAAFMSRISIDADGTPMALHPDGRVDRMPARFDGLAPAMRRTAVAITMIFEASRHRSFSNAP